jgi:hypothetical protein
MFSIDSRDFLNDPLSFGFNTTKQIFVFSHILIFRAFRTSNGSNLFATSFFQEIEDHEKKKSMGDATRRKRGPTMRAHFLSAWWGPSRAL